MDRREALFNQIESYLRDELTADERSAFEREMAANTDLQREVRVQRDLQHAIELNGVESTIADVDRAYHSPKIKSLTWVKIAAGLAILISVGIWAMTRASHTDKLFAEHVTEEPGLPVPMSSEASFEFYDAMVDFKMGKYDLAIEKWSLLESSGRFNDTLDYFIGVSHFELGEYPSAVERFELVNADSEKFGAKAQWYSVLAYLKLQELDKIREVKVIPDSPYAERIAEIRNALD